MDDMACWSELHEANDKILAEFQALRCCGGFRVILADPPWEFRTYSERGAEKSPAAHYNTMSDGAISLLPVNALAASDCVLFLWVTWPKMKIWGQILSSWGFEYKGLAWEWRKYNPKTGKYAFGAGYGTRKNLEPCLLATTGNPSLRKDLPPDLFGLGPAPAGMRSVRDWMEWWPEDEIRAPRRQHSRKPDEQYGRIEVLFEGPYIELFSRSDRPGWTAWGDQVGMFDAGGVEDDD